MYKPYPECGKHNHHNKLKCAVCGVFAHSCYGWGCGQVFHTAYKYKIQGHAHNYAVYIRPFYSIPPFQSTESILKYACIVLLGMWSYSIQIQIQCWHTATKTVKSETTSHRHIPNWKYDDKLICSKNLKSSLGTHNTYMKYLNRHTHKNMHICEGENYVINIHQARSHTHPLIV